MSYNSTGLSDEALKKYIPLDMIHLTEVDSTNTYAKSLAGKKEITTPLVILADSQHGGRGRLGRSFFSEDGTGIYMSILLFPEISPSDIQHITTAAAAATCRAIEALTDLSPKIKWVNDIYIGGKKIAGILTEGSFDPVQGKISHAVLGIGINVFSPARGFPEDIKSIAASIFPETYPEHTDHNSFFREKLAGRIIDEFMVYYKSISQKPHFSDYKKRMLLTSQEVSVITPISCTDAKVIDLLDDFSLLVEYPSGKREALLSGEVSLKIK